MSKNQRISLGFVTAFLGILMLGQSVLAADTVVVISPHRKSIQNEFLPAFKAWYKTKHGVDVEVEWLDQGGSNQNVKFVQSKFASTPKGIGVDVFWGGGTTAFNELDNSKLLDKLTIPPELEKQLPKVIAKMPLGSKDGTFISQAMSSFGIFYNKVLLKQQKISEPNTWSDLGDLKFRDNIVLTDSRKSGSSSVINHVILEAYGWEKGFEVLFRLAGNALRFTQSSSDPIKAIVSGDAAATVAIDFYALAKIGDIGADKLGYTLPDNQSIIEGDPLAILKGAPNRKAADRFVEYLLSPEAQLILMLPKGTAGGPKLETLGRLAVNTASYAASEGKRVNTLNPFTAKGFLYYDTDKAAAIRPVFDDLIGALMVDNHKELRAAWAKVAKGGAKAEDVAAFAKVPVTKAELEKHALKWSDNVYRNDQINQWVKFSKEKFEKLSK